MNRRHRILRKLLWAALLVPFAELVYPGCGLLMGKGKQTVAVQSTPTHARVFLDNRFVGEEPVAVKATRLGVHLLRLELYGFEPVSIPIHHGVDKAVVAGDLVIGGAPIVIDSLTGSILSLEVAPQFRNPDPGGVAEFELPPLSVLVQLHPSKHGTKIAQMRRK